METKNFIKKTISRIGGFSLLFLMATLVFVSCKKESPILREDPPGNEESGIIFTAGHTTVDENKVATYWINNAQSPLSNGEYVLPLPTGAASSFATGIVSDGHDVYVSGNLRKVVSETTGSTQISSAAYWKNGNTQMLDNGTSSATAVALDNGALFVSGSKGENAAFWKDGAATILDIDGAHHGVATDVTIVEGKIFLSGYLSFTVNQNQNTAQSINRAVYWEGVGSNFTLHYLDGENSTTPSMATSIVVTDGAVFVAGGIDVKAVFWKNGELQALNDNVNAIATGIVVEGGHTFISGAGDIQGPIAANVNTALQNMESRAVYWKDGERQNLAPANSYASAIDIEANGNIYNSGNSDDKAVYWKGNDVDALSAAGSAANAIFIFE